MQDMTEKTDNSNKKDWKFIVSTLFSLFIPTVLIALGYGLLWAILRFAGFSVLFRKEIISFYIPIIIALVSVWYISRRVRSFIPNSPLTFIQIVLVFSLWGLTSNVVKSVDVLTAETLSVKRFIDIRKPLDADYLKVDTLDVDTARKEVFFTSELIHRHHTTNIRFECYIILPIKGQQNVYYGFDYNETGSYTFRSEEQLERDYEDFIDTSYRRILDYPYGETKILKRLDASSEHDKFVQALPEEMSSTIAGSKPIIYVNTDKDAFPSPIRNLLYGLFFLLMGIILSTITFFFTSKNKHKEQDSKEKEEITSLIQNLLLNKEYLPLTIPPIIIFVYFWVMTFSGVSPMVYEADILIHWGAGDSELILNEGQWWRLITAIFTHAGMEHAGGNLASYIFATLYLLPLAKPKQISLIFFSSAIFANIVCAQAANYVFVGASGGVLGMFGACVVLILLQPKGIQKNKFALGICMFFITANILIGFSKDVSMIIHVTGLAFGAMSGGIIYFYEHKEEVWDE